MTQKGRDSARFARNVEPFMSILSRLHRYPAPCIIGLLAASGLAGQTVAPIPLEKVEVVASPIVDGTKVDDFAQQVTTVGPEQIDALDAQDLASALRRTPGVTITRYNEVGAFGGGEGGAILLRGLGSSRPGGEIKTTVDGVPNYNAVFNHPLLDLMSIDLAARLEVSRRAEPLAAGNMFAGVNAVTPRMTVPGAFAETQLAVGRFGRWMEKLEAGAKRGDFDAYIGQSHREADGHRPDSDGALNNYLVHLGWQPVGHWDVSYVLDRTDNRATDPGPEAGAGLPPTRGDVYLTENWLHILTTAWDYENSSGSLKGYWNEGEATWLRRASSNNADSLNRYRLSGVRGRETLRPWRGGAIVAGADYDLARGSTVSVPPGGAPSASFGPEEFRLVSIYAGLSQTWRMGNAVVVPSVGMRYYDHEVFGAATAWQGGVVVRRGASEFHAGASEAVNFPGLDVAAFSAVAIPALGQTWRALKPERLAQYELGWRQTLSPALAVELTVFRNDGRDRYVFVPPPPPPFRYLNVEHFRTQGAELTLTAAPSDRLSLFAGVSGLDVTPGDLPYAPEWSLSGGATWRLAQRWTLNVDGSYLSGQYAGAQSRASGAPNTERVGAFALLNARLAWAFAGGEIYAAVENLLDRHYAYRPGYPMPGAGGTVGLRVKW